MNKLNDSITELSGIKNLDNAELNRLLEALHEQVSDVADMANLKPLLHELQVHQIELEMQNRELIEARQLVEEARDRYADLYDFAPVSYITFDARGCIQEVNLTGASLLGQERTRLVGKPFSRYLTKESLPVFFRHLRQIQEGDKVTRVELRLQPDKGARRDVSLESIAAPRSAVDKPLCRCIIIDISERKQAERVVLDQTRQLALISDAMPVLIAYIDTDERYQFVNKPYSEWFHLPRDKIIGQTVRDMIGDEYYMQVKDFIQIARLGRPVSFEIAMSRPNQAESEQRMLNFSVSYIPDFDADGRVVGYFVTKSDVTEVKRHDAEDRIRLLETAHTARVNTMGLLVTEIAHELNQPLGAITIYSDAISRMLEKSDSKKQDMLLALGEIKFQALRAGEVINRLREFVSKKEFKAESIDINALVEDVLHLIKVEAQWYSVTVKLDLAQDLPDIFVDKILIEQVIFNLTRNAITAMSKLDEGRRHLSLKTARGSKDEIELTVEDCGPGMTETEIAQAFEPFRTTEKNQGIGMGLPICLSIIKAHHGRLWAIPNEHGGTAFSFTLPIAGRHKQHDTEIPND